MEARVSSSLCLPSPKPHEISISTSLSDFPSLFTHFPPFASTTSVKWPRPNPKPQPLKSLPLLDHPLIGAAVGGLAGSFTYVCLLPLHTIKTKMQTKGMNMMVINHLDKLFFTNDAATIVNELEVQHPATKIWVLVGKAQ